MTEYTIGLTRTDIDILEVEGSMFLVLEDMSTINIELMDQVIKMIIPEIYLEGTHLKVLKDVGYLYVTDKDGNTVKLIYGQVIKWISQYQ